MSKVKDEEKTVIRTVKEDQLLTNSVLPFEITMKNTLNMIQFYCNIMCRSGPNVLHSIDYLMTFNNESLMDTKDVLKSTKQLKVFLSKFPQFFKVNDNTVILRNWIVFHINQQEWLNELLSKRSDTNLQLIISTIQFYCNVLFTKAFGFGLNVSKLFKYKSNAPVAIQAVTQNLKEFIKFLRTHPEIFIFKKNIVTLTGPAKFFKSMTTWISRLVDFIKPNYMKNFDSESSELEIQTHDVAKNEIAINEAIAFYYKIILNAPVQLISSHYLICKRNKATPRIQALAKNWRELKVLLSCYPQVFSLNNDMVLLTHLQKDTFDFCRNNDSNQLNCACELRDGSYSENKEKFVIDFYSNIICKISQVNDKITELPINHLYYYSLKAPEVNEVASNATELKKCLMKYPNVFKICDNHIIIQHKTNLIINNEATTIAVDNGSSSEKSANEAIDFYTNLLITSGGTAKIAQLLVFRNNLTEDVHSVATNLEELKKFLNTYPNNFIVQNDTVLLTNIQKHRKNETKVHVKKHEVIKNKAVLFYCDFIKKHGNKLLNLNRLIGYRSCAPADVKSVAKNLVELKAYLSQFPEIFTILDDSVKLSNLSHDVIITKDQYLLHNITNCNDNSQNAIDFYSQILNNHGISRVMSINKLFEFKTVSSPHVQKISGCNIDQFRQFLMQYPNYFIVTSDNVIGKRNIPKWSYSSKYENKKFKDPLLIVINNFFQRYTLDKSLIHIDNLYNNIGRFFLYGDLTPIFESESDLLLFLALYPHVFYVDNARIVNLVASSRKTFEIRKSIKNDKISKDCNDKISKDCNYRISKDCNYRISKDNEVFEENTIFGENQFIPLSIDDIEAKVFAQFTSKLNMNNCKKMGQCKEDHFDINKFYNFPKSFREIEDCKGLTIETLIFLNFKLWENEQLTILETEELFKIFFISPLEIKKYYCRNLDEFNNFLSSFPNDFIISNGYVMAKKNRIRGSRYFESTKLESLPEMLFNFFNLYTQYNNPVSLKLLFDKVGKYFWNVNMFQIFKFSKDLVLFLKMFPDVFYLENNCVNNLIAFREKCKNLQEGNVTNKFEVSKHCIQIDSFDKTNYYTTAIVPESAMGWKNFVLRRTQVIEDINQCLCVTTDILKFEKVIALDCEGVNLGATGMLTLIQVGLENGQIYIFDVAKDRTMIRKGGLKDILESKSIIKVIHDSRNDVANLYTEFNVKVYNVFDTRIAHHLIVTSGKNSNCIISIGFNDLCTKYGVPINIEKDEMKNVYKYNYMFWMGRPLTKDMIAYAALDVASLVPDLYKNLLLQLRQTKINLERLVFKMSGNYSTSSLSHQNLLFDYDCA